jgi:hypothetical protein
MKTFCRAERALARNPPKLANHQQKTTATYDSQTAQPNASKEQTQYDNPAHEHRTNKRNLAIILPPTYPALQQSTQAGHPQTHQPRNPTSHAYQHADAHDNEPKCSNRLFSQMLTFLRYVQV